MVTDMHPRKAEMAIHFLIQNAEQRHPPADVDQSSMLKVICNQRDCVRARLRETEEDGPLRIEASSTGSNSTISKIVNMVEEAQGREAPIQRLSDSIDEPFVYSVMT